jgi:hypothetical protein
MSGPNEVFRRDEYRNVDKGVSFLLASVAALLTFMVAIVLIESIETTVSGGIPEANDRQAQSQETQMINIGLQSAAASR